MSGLFGGGGSGSNPAPLPKVAPTPVAPKVDDKTAKIQKEKAAAVKAASKGGGRAATMLTDDKLG